MRQALVIAALICNAALVGLAAADGGPTDALFVLVVGAPPASLLVLPIRPRVLRVLAGLFGLFYVMVGGVALFVGGALFVPAGLLLLCAALCPVRVAAPR